MPTGVIEHQGNGFDTNARDHSTVQGLPAPRTRADTRLDPVRRIRACLRWIICAVVRPSHRGEQRCGRHPELRGNAQWPAGSDAWRSYWTRIASGPDFTAAQAYQTSGLPARAKPDKNVVAVR
jgi:hypothetical protein